MLAGLNWSGSCELNGLSAASLYRATVAGVNVHGRAPPSAPPFTFGTRGARLLLEDDQEIEAAGGSSSHSSQLSQLFTWLLVLVSLLSHV